MLGYLAVIEINCPFELVKGKWKCPQCKWVYSLQTETPPLRNCPRGPSGLDRVFAAVQQFVQDEHADICPACFDSFLKTEWPAVEARIRICYDCDKFDGHTCPERGTECKRFTRWIERLRIGHCELWDD